jgi:hypothetical protein
MALVQHTSDPTSYTGQRRSVNVVKTRILQFWVEICNFVKTSTYKNLQIVFSPDTTKLLLSFCSCMNLVVRIKLVVTIDMWRCLFTSCMRNRKVSINKLPTPTIHMASVLAWDSPLVCLFYLNCENRHFLVKTFFIYVLSRKCIYLGSIRIQNSKVQSLYMGYTSPRTSVWGKWFIVGWRKWKKKGTLLTRAGGPPIQHQRGNY